MTTLFTLRALPASAKIVASRDQVSCELAGEAAILNLKNSNYYGLDPVGARIWALIQSPSTIGAIRDALVAEYDVDPQRFEHDLIELVGELSAEGLVELVESPSVD